MLILWYIGVEKWNVHFCIQRIKFMYIGILLSRFCNGLAWSMTRENLHCFFLEEIQTYETNVVNGSLGAWWFCLGWRKGFALNYGLGLKVQGEAIYDAFWETALKILLLLYFLFILSICTNFFSLYNVCMSNQFWFLDPLCLLLLFFHQSHWKVTKSDTYILGDG